MFRAYSLRIQVLEQATYEKVSVLLVRQASTLFERYIFF